jgi:hypothetical protein
MQMPITTASDFTQFPPIPYPIFPGAHHLVLIRDMDLPQIREIQQRTRLSLQLPSTLQPYLAHSLISPYGLNRSVRPYEIQKLGVCIEAGLLSGTSAWKPGTRSY